MQCYVYKSLKQDLLFLYIDKKDDFSRVPAELLQSFGTLEFVLEMELTPERKLAKEDSKQVLQVCRKKVFLCNFHRRMILISVESVTGW